MALRPNYCATVGAAAVWLLILSGSALGQDTTLTSLRGDSTVKVQTDSISLRLLDVDIRTAIQALGRYLDRPVVFGSIGTARVTLETPKPVPRGEALSLLRGVLDANNLELHEDSGYLRVSVREQTRVRTPGSGQPDQLQFYTIRLSHARATDVAATVNALYGRASALGEIGERPRTLASELAAARAPIEASPATQAAPRAAVFSGDVVIVPDPRSNSLLVRASESDFELIEAAIKELDIRPLQVLIEVLIAEVRKDRSFDLGTSITLPKTPVSGAANATVEGESGLGLSLGDFALRIMNLGPS